MTIIILIFGLPALLCLAVVFISRRPVPRSDFRAMRYSTWRNPGESDSDMIDRLLNASPTHQTQLKEGK